MSDEAKTAKYRGLLAVNSGSDNASIYLSDGKDSFIGNATRASLASPSDDTIAQTNAETSFEKVREVFDGINDTSGNNAKGSARVINEPDEDVMNDESRHELRVAACWGAEFGLSDVHVDVAAVRLQRKKGNGQFLDATFARLKSSREEIAKIEEEEKKVGVEIEDLAEAHRYLEEAQTEANRRKRLQKLVDELNAYKRKCRENAGAG